MQFHHTDDIGIEWNPNRVIITGCAEAAFINSYKLKRQGEYRSTLPKIIVKALNWFVLICNLFIANI